MRTFHVLMHHDEASASKLVNLTEVSDSSIWVDIVVGSWLLEPWLRLHLNDMIRADL